MPDRIKFERPDFAYGREDLQNILTLECNKEGFQSGRQEDGHNHAGR
jgi:hypothetical protein